MLRIEGQGASTSGYATGSTGYWYDGNKFAGSNLSPANAEYLSGSSRIGSFSTYTNNTIFVGLQPRFENTVGK